jgi:hypothetical protein
MLIKQRPALKDKILFFNVPGDGDCAPHSLRVLRYALTRDIKTSDEIRDEVCTCVRRATRSKLMADMYDAARGQEKAKTRRYMHFIEIALAVQGGILGRADINVVIMNRAIRFNRVTYEAMTVYSKPENQKWIFLAMTGGAGRGANHYEIVCEVTSGDQPRMVFDSGDHVVNELLSLRDSDQVFNFDDIYIIDTPRDVENLLYADFGFARPRRR